MKNQPVSGSREWQKGRERKEEEPQGASLRKKAGLFSYFLSGPLPLISLSLIYLTPQAPGPALGGALGGCIRNITE